MLSGASLTTEKTYLMGKFARVCLKTPFIDYNGRLCMVSAGAGNKKAFGIDRAANPWSDIVGSEVVWIGGANVAECAPITTNYVWQAREQGAKIIVVDPRITPIARTCDLFLPVKPGRDIALFNGILKLMIDNDWVDHPFIKNHTVGFDALCESVQSWTPAKTAEVTGIAERLGIADGDWTTITSRRADMTVRAMIVKTIRPDTVFIPYHWAGKQSVNRLTIAAQDPISKIPEYKVCAVRLSKAERESNV